MNNEILPLDDGRQIPGQVCLANESRFNAAFLSEPLTAYTVGWQDPEDLQSLLDFIAPPVPVGRRFEFRKAVNSEAFVSETDDLRAIGSSFKRIEFTGETVNAKTLNKGLTVRIDHDEQVGGDWQERHVALLMQRLLRNEVRRAIAALDSEDTNQDKTWTYDSSTNPNPDPDGDVRRSFGLAADASGVRPNRVLWGEAAWDLRADAYFAQQGAGAFRSAGQTPAELASRLLVDGIRVVKARYQSSATSKSKILGNQVFAFYALDGQMKDEPSNIKRFLTPVDSGNFRVYLEESAKYTDISVEHYSNIIITSTLGIRKISAS